MEAHGNGFDSRVEVELRGLSIYTHHGVSDSEQEVGQRLEIDVNFDVPDCDAVLTDRIEDTIDYAEVCDIVALAATERSYKTLERLCHVIGERLMERFACAPLSLSHPFPWPSARWPSRSFTSARSPTRRRSLASGPGLYVWTRPLG